MKPLLFTLSFATVSFVFLFLVYITATETHISLPLFPSRVVSWIVGTTLTALLTLLAILFLFRSGHLWCAIAVLVVGLSSQILAAVLTFKWSYPQMVSIDKYHSALDQKIHQLASNRQPEILTEIMDQQPLLNPKQRASILESASALIVTQVQKRNLRSTLLKKEYYLDPAFGGNNNGSFEAQLYQTLFEKDGLVASDSDFCEVQGDRVFKFIAQHGVDQWRVEVERENPAFSALLHDIYSLDPESLNEIQRKIETLKSNTNPSATLGSLPFYSVCIFSRSNNKERETLRSLLKLMRLNGFSFLESESRVQGLTEFIGMQNSI